MNKGRFVLKRVISGKQVGADQAALRAARHLGLETGGMCVKAQIPSTTSECGFPATHGLTQDAGTETANTVLSNKCNVDDAQVTLAFRSHHSHNIDCVIGYCITGSWNTDTSFALSSSVDALAYATPGCRKPLLVVQHMTLGAQEAVRVFLRTHKVSVLNVVGHKRMYSEPGWEDAVEQFLIKALAE